jgi:hypothetical protein
MAIEPMTWTVFDWFEIQHEVEARLGKDIRDFSGTSAWRHKKYQDKEQWQIETYGLNFAQAREIFGDRHEFYEITNAEYEIERSDVAWGPEPKYQDWWHWFLDVAINLDDRPLNDTLRTIDFDQLLYEYDGVRFPEDKAEDWQILILKEFIAVMKPFEPDQYSEFRIWFSW